MNREYILNKIKPYLNDKGMLGEKDFNKLFGILNRHEQYRVIDILIEENIEIDYINVSIDNVEKSKKEIGKKLDKLTNEQLCAIYQKGNNEALEALIIKNKKLIWSRVQKYYGLYNHKLNQEDLFQYGVIGLIKGAQKFELKKEAKFTTYVVWWIDQSILRNISDYGFTIRIPVHYFVEINRLIRVFREHPEYSKEQIFEIVKDTGMDRHKFEELLQIFENILSPSSLNSFVGEHEETELVEFVVDELSPTVEEQVECKMLKSIINDVLNTLTPREEKVLRLRFGLDDGKERTLEEVGREFKVTRERIRQIEAKALRKLRHPSRAKNLKDFLQR